MIKLISVSDVRKIIAAIGLPAFFQQLVDEVEIAYSQWNTFDKSPRHATHVPDGVIELMPISNDHYYAFKYVNGHPKNPLIKKQTVVAMGMLADVKTGYPLMISEMTLLTAFRTAATSALAAKYLANSNVKSIGIIGTGAQSEFQILAMSTIFPIQTVRYFDIDSHAMKKFERNLQNQSFQLIPCYDAQSAVDAVDIITTATAGKHHTRILSSEWIRSGVHINAIGGDTPGKTELGVDLLQRTKIVVEYLLQSAVEGEIQQLTNEKSVYAELWEIVSGKKKGRVSSEEITLFDSVGFAIEDYAVLKCIFELSKRYNLGTEMEMIPELRDPKNLFETLW